MSDSNRGIVRWEVGPDQPSVIVLMCNDSVIGVYTDEQAEGKAKKEFHQKVQDSYSWPSYIQEQVHRAQTNQEVRTIKEDHIAQVFYLHSRSFKINQAPTR